MATMSLLLAAHDAGLGALFFAVFNDPERIRRHFGVPEQLQLLGAIALGWPNSTSARRGASATRRRATANEIVHRERVLDPHLAGELLLEFAHLVALVAQRVESVTKEHAPAIEDLVDLCPLLGADDLESRHRYIILKSSTTLSKVRVFL